MRGKKKDNSITLTYIKKKSSSHQTNYLRYYNLIKYFEKFKRNLLVKISRIHYFMLEEFKLRLEEKLNFSMKNYKNENCRFSLFFILYKYDNIKNYDDTLLLEIFPENENKKIIFSIEESSSLSEFFSEFLKIKNDLKKKIEKNLENQVFGNLKIICVFKGILNLSSEDLGLFLKSLDEDIFFDKPNFRFFFIFQTIETKKFNFEKKNIFVEKLFFEQTQGYFYKFLYQIIKKSVLKDPVFSPDFIKNIVKNYLENIVPLEQEVKKWIKFKEVHFIIYREYMFTEILYFEDKNKMDMVDLYNKKFKIGLKILKFVFSSIFQIKKKDIICKLMVNYFCNKKFSLYNLSENYPILQNRFDLIELFKKFWEEKIIENNLQKDIQIIKFFDEINSILIKKKKLMRKT